MYSTVLYEAVNNLAHRIKNSNFFENKQKRYFAKSKSDRTYCTVCTQCDRKTILKYKLFGFAQPEK